MRIITIFIFVTCCAFSSVDLLSVRSFEIVHHKNSGVEEPITDLKLEIGSKNPELLSSISIQGKLNGDYHNLRVYRAESFGNQVYLINNEVKRVLKESISLRIPITDGNSYSRYRLAYLDCNHQKKYLNL